MTDAPPVDRYLELGLRLGRHVDGFVDAYYGPPALADRVAAEPIVVPATLAAQAADLIGDLDGGAGEPELGPARRHWLRGQVVGLHTSARKLAGVEISYADEVERCYGVRPTMRPEDEFEEAHQRLDAVLPGSGPLAERFVTWREAQAIPADKLRAVIDSLADDFRERTQRTFGLPEGEHVDWELATDKPWSGFNYYLGGLRSRVAINVDLPVLSTSIAHLVAHEAYPGHHTEHTRKEVGLVRNRGHEEETIFLVGTPQCLITEGLADLALEVIAGERPEPVVLEHLRPLGVPYDPEVVAAVSQAGEALNNVRGNVAFLLHEHGAPADDAIAYAERWGLVSHDRAEKMLQFLTDPTWRAYISCYLEGLPLCRRFTGGDPERFRRLLDESLLPSDLVSAA
jgi:hypothetical protein